MENAKIFLTFCTVICAAYAGEDVAFPKCICALGELRAMLLTYRITDVRKAALCCCEQRTTIHEPQDSFSYTRHLGAKLMPSQTPSPPPASSSLANGTFMRRLDFRYQILCGEQEKHERIDDIVQHFRKNIGLLDVVACATWHFAAFAFYLHHRIALMRLFEARKCTSFCLENMVGYK